jgi:nucleoside-diphosphate-sugar epimerase
MENEMSDKNKKLLDVIVPPNSTIRSVIEHIGTNGARGVFVCDDDRELLGVIMDSDIRRNILKKINLDTSVKTIMNTTPFIINHNIPNSKRKKLFSRSDKILVPIVDDRRCLVDFITIHDFLDELYSNQGLNGDNGDEGILPPERILVIGGAGYVGSFLVEKLLKMGYQVRVLDLLLYGKEAIRQIERKGLEFIRGDCRDEETVRRVLDGVSAVIHLGEIVGDPACEINETFTIDTNYSATHMIVELCIKHGIKRFMFTSSCSVYGQNDNEVDEESELNPVSLYASCKIESEKAILSCSNSHFCPSILRLATVHGRSYRQRFDLIANYLTIKGLIEKKIQIVGGEQWRPFISVKDVCSGIITVLHADGRKVKNQVFNLGDSRENYRISEIGSIVNNVLPDVQVEVLKGETDKRNYKVNFDKIKHRLGFTAENTVYDTVKDLSHAYYQEGLFHDYKEAKYHNLHSLTLK